MEELHFIKCEPGSEPEDLEVQHAEIKEEDTTQVITNAGDDPSIRAQIHSEEKPIKTEEDVVSNKIEISSDVEDTACQDPLKNEEFITADTWNESQSSPMPGDANETEEHDEKWDPLTCPMSLVTAHLGNQATKQRKTGDKPYSCELCTHTFHDKRNLYRHKKTHTDERPYSCDLCGRTFKQRTHVEVHKVTHTGEKPHTCDFCGRAFNNKPNLNRHIKIHTGEKPYSCDLCCRTFNQQGHLDAHRVTHTGQKLYSCNICNRSYYVKCSLNNHIKTHSKEKSIPPSIQDKPYSCNVCSRAFKVKRSLSRHKKSHTLK